MHRLARREGNLPFEFQQSVWQQQEGQVQADATDTQTANGTAGRHHHLRRALVLQGLLSQGDLLLLYAELEGQPENAIFSHTQACSRKQ